jgi:diketogulonate reductase-like aldo/keto reductase
MIEPPTVSAAAPTRSLLDGHLIPQLGLGTWPMDDAEARSAVRDALSMGYRLIDTAARYGNEAGVGAAIAASDVPREELFVTTKLRGSQQGFDEALAGLGDSLERLGLDYVDLFLIHWPLPEFDRYVDTWRAFVRLREEGLARSIGVSNFMVEHLERLERETGVRPAVNQVELHPGLAQPALREYHDVHHIATQSWSPLGAGRGLLDHPVVGEIARARRRTPAQIVLRWHIQLGAIPIPKSSSPRRLAENLDVFGFELGDDEILALAGLDRGRRRGGDPRFFIEW